MDTNHTPIETAVHTKHMIVPLGTDQVRHIHFTNDPRYNEHRFGGRAPVGIEPKDKTSIYLLTLGIRDDYFVSIFLKDDGYFFIDNTYVLFSKEDFCVEVFFHTNLPRREDDLYRSTYSGHGIHIGPLQKDEFLDGDTFSSPDSANKLGGKTYLINDHLDIFGELESKGFHQFLQLDGSGILGPGLDIKGNAPFGLGILHFYVKPAGDGFDWRCFVESS